MLEVRHTIVAAIHAPFSLLVSGAVNVRIRADGEKPVEDAFSLLVSGAINVS